MRPGLLLPYSTALLRLALTARLLPSAENRNAISPRGMPPAAASPGWQRRICDHPDGVVQALRGEGIVTRAGTMRRPGSAG